MKSPGCLVKSQLEIFLLSRLAQKRENKKAQENGPIKKTNELFQVGIVVRDLQKSMQLYTELLGIDDWMDIELTNELFNSLTYNGKPVEKARFLTGIANVGAIQLELIQPIDGDLPFFDYLKKHGEGLHHIGHLYVSGMEQVVRELEAQGYPCIFSGDAGVKFAYVDMTKTLGTIIELLEIQDE